MTHTRNGAPVTGLERLEMHMISRNLLQATANLQPVPHYAIQMPAVCPVDTFSRQVWIVKA